MRSSIAIVAFAATALAAPYVKREDVIVTEVDVAYATDVVTVVATEVDTVTADAPAPTSSADDDHHWGGHGGWGGWTGWGWSWSPPSTTSTPPPAPTTPTSTYVPPPPTTTTEAPPPPTTEAPAPAPTTPTTTWTPPPAPSTTEEPPTTWAPPAPSSSNVASTTSSQEIVTWTESAAYTGYSEAVVAHHNFHRYNHSAPDVVWNASLAKSAQDIADKCVYAHDTSMDGGGYGQNIAAGVDMNNISSIITDMFYNGEVNWYNSYGQSDPDMSEFEHWGHFSQIIWSNTTSVACATSNCTGKGLGGVDDGVGPYFTVCNYFPPGNWAGDYKYNVKSSKEIPTIPYNAA